MSVSFNFVHALHSIHRVCNRFDNHILIGFCGCFKLVNVSVCNHRVEAKLSKNKLSKQSFWRIFSLAK